MYLVLVVHQELILRIGRLRILLDTLRQPLVSPRYVRHTHTHTQRQSHTLVRQDITRTCTRTRTVANLTSVPASEPWRRFLASSRCPRACPGREGVRGSWPLCQRCSCSARECTARTPCLRPLAWTPISSPVYVCMCVCVYWLAALKCQRRHRLT